MWKDYDFYEPIVKAEYDKKHEWWILLRGPETFYDENNRLRVWDTKEEALEWVQINYPKYKVIE
jgi:hypothetical protein